MSYIFLKSLSQKHLFFNVLHLNIKPSVVFNNTPIGTHLSLPLAPDK